MNSGFRPTKPLPTNSNTEPMKVCVASERSDEAPYAIVPIRRAAKFRGKGSRSV